MKAKLIITVLLLMAPAALAEEKADPETRFHDAFFAEVVDGKVAEAAKTYFELLEDETVSVHLRREASFRFAVCCVLLGRADEGRARLAEILADPTTPFRLKARAEEYRNALDGIGIGLELDRRLQELTFELARAEGSEIPKAYSDIRVIGKPAVPYLKRLLGHADERLRRHAFVLLCMLDEPGMASVWKPGLSRLMSAPFAEYLNGHSEEKKRIEQRLTELPIERLPEALPAFRDVTGFSEEFLNGLADRKGLEDWTFELLDWDQTDRAQLLRNWLVTGRRPISRRAAMTITSLIDFAPDRAAEVMDLFPHLVASLVAEELNWRRWGQQARSLRAWSSARKVQPRRAGLTKIAEALPTPSLLEVLTQLVESGEKWEGDPWTNPLFSGLADAVADGLDAKPPEEANLAPYAALVERWITCFDKLDLSGLARLNRSPNFPDEEFLKHLAYLFNTLPEEDATRFTRRLFTGPAGHSPVFARPLSTESPRNIRLLQVAWESVEASARSGIIGYLPFFLQTTRMRRDKALAEAHLALLPKLLPTLDHRQMQMIYGNYWLLASMLPTEAALDNIVAVAAAGGDPKRMVEGLLAVRHYISPGFTQYRIRISVPALQRLWAEAPDTYSRHLLSAALEFVKHDNEAIHPLGDVRETVASFVLEHVGALTQSQLMDLSRDPETFPPEVWIPAVSPEFWGSGGGPQVIECIEACEEVVAGMSRDLDKVNASVVAFILQSSLPGNVKRRLMSRFLQSGDPRLAKLVLSRVTHGEEVGAGTLEEFLEVALAMEKPDLGLVRPLSLLLVSTHPTEKLIPAAQELLASLETPDRHVGIHLATELGKEELIPYLVKLLDSVDSSIRNGAKGAIDAIQELKRMREATYK